jgi:uncharacterized RDD family membrane protein YckC
MVIPDWKSTRRLQGPISPSNAHASNHLLARPTDRLAAVIIDLFVLLGPVFVLLSSPIRRQMTASFILGVDGDFIARIVSLLILAIILIVTYQGAMHHFFGATVGKMIFRLRVVPVFPDGRLSWMSSLARGCVWVCELFLLGLPYLAIFSNSKRRTLHDRVCDSMVVSTSSEHALTPAAWERGAARGFLMACLGIFLLTGYLKTRHTFQELRDSGQFSGMIMDHKSDECEAVSDHVTDEVSEHGRLQVAMSLFAAGQVDKSCLEAEIELEKLMHVAVGPLTYLAQAFVNADDAEISNSYLDQVCEDAPDSIECSMSMVVSQWSDENLDEVENTLGKAKKGSGYLEVWGVRHFMKQGQYREALELLDVLSTHREVAEFSLVQRVKALYNSYLDKEARVALAQALPSISPDEAADISSWMCAQDLQQGCDSLKQLSCSVVDLEQTELNEIDFDRTSEALSKVMALECHDEKKLDYSSFEASVQNEDWKHFFEANHSIQKGDRETSFDQFQDILDSKSAPDMLKIEVFRRVAKFANNQQLRSIHDTWQRLENHEAWAKAGNILLTRYVEQNNSNAAMAMSKDLMSSGALAPELYSQVQSMTEALRGRTRMPASEPRKGRKK